MTSRVLLLMVAAIIVVPMFSSAQNLLNGPESIAFDPDHDRYLVSNWRNGAIVQIALDQTTQTPYHQFSYQVLGNCIADGVFYTSRSASPGGVAAFDLSADTLLWNITISGSFQVDGMTADTSGFLYVVHMNPDRLYRINLSDLSYSTFASTGLPGTAQAVAFDEVNNRLIVVGYAVNSPIVAVSLPSGTLSDLVPFSPGGFDGVTIDNNGTIYASVYNAGIVYSWSADGTNFRLVSAGHQGGPAGLDYNRRDEILAVPCVNANRIDFLAMGDDDGDNFPYFSDNCPETYNPAQEDYDLDGIGDSCDVCTDSDQDGFGDPGFPANTCAPDNCPEQWNEDQNDLDQDGVGDECDNCLLTYNPDQLDLNENDIGDACETCCVGRVGDANGQSGDEPTISDISTLIDAKFITGTCGGDPPKIACLAEADSNQSGGADPTCDDITISDISKLIDYLFITGPETATLPDCL